MPRAELDARIALVTGARQGIGAAIAARLAEDGAQVVGVDVDDRAHPGAWPILACDVTDEDQVLALAEQANVSFGGPTILVNNAGIYPVTPLEETTLEQWHHVLHVNLDSVFLMCRAFVPAMKANGFGRIINVASNTFHAGTFPNYTAYIASKGAVIGFTRALASELGASGITVNAIAPGLVETATTLANRAPEVFEAVRAEQAIPRVGTPADLVSAVSFLAARDSSWVTGQTLVLDGGLARA